jgi:CHAT domain-containing protein
VTTGSYSAPLLQHFHTRLAKDEDTSSAVRQAEAALKEFEKDPSPSYWGGFDPVGGGRWYSFTPKISP